MRHVAELLRCRATALVLGVVGILLGLAATPPAPGSVQGDTAAFLRWIAAIIILTAGQRLIYLALLDRDLKFSEGHRAGFRLGRQTTRPVIVPLASRPERGEAQESLNG